MKTVTTGTAIPNVTQYAMNQKYAQDDPSTTDAAFEEHVVRLSTCDPVIIELKNARGEPP